MRLPSRLAAWRHESLVLLAAYSAVALAQGNGGNNDDDEEDDSPAQTRNTPQPTEDSSDNDNNKDDEEDDEDDSQPTKQETREATKTTESKTSPTKTTSSKTTSSKESKTSSTSSASTDYSYPPPAVPPTINAPFMDRSTMPDGTVFIAVGAILGTFGLAILVWRAIVACLLHRSVARAAAAQHIANEKSTHLPPAGMAKKSKRKPSSPGRGGGRRTSRGPMPSHTPSQSNLFFSPTAAGSAGMGSNRDSRYLPSGFYAAGSAPAPPANYTSLRPDSRGQQFSRSTLRDVSPEGSPQYAARGGDPSMSSLNLAQAPGQRAPSAYLDDLLDENPHMFPPPMPPQASRHHHSHSNSSQGRR